jgi:hypothetical protein
VPLFVDADLREHRGMFYKKPTQWQRLRRRRGLRTIAAFFAGIHAANGVAHGVTPSKASPARRC